MRQLVQDGIQKILFGNLCLWQNDARTEKTDQQRRGDERVDTEVYWPFYADLYGDRGQPIQNFNVGNRRHSGADITDIIPVDHHFPQQKTTHNGKPDQPDMACKQRCDILKKEGGGQISGRAVCIFDILFSILFSIRFCTLLSILFSTLSSLLCQDSGDLFDHLVFLQAELDLHAP